MSNTTRQAGRQTSRQPQSQRHRPAVRELNVHRTTLTLAELARAINPVLAGWLAYFTRFYPTAVIPLCKRINRHLIRWAKRKYKRLERSSKRAWAWLAAVAERAPRLFAHWEYCATT